MHSEFCNTHQVCIELPSVDAEIDDAHTQEIREHLEALVSNLSPCGVWCHGGRNDTPRGADAHMVSGRDIKT